MTKRQLSAMRDRIDKEWQRACNAAAEASSSNGEWEEMDTLCDVLEAVQGQLVKIAGRRGGEDAGRYV